MGQFKKLYTNLSAAQRITIVLAAIAVGAGLFSFARWRRESDFRPLYTTLASEDAGAVVQKLKETGVEYRLSENGSTILVPSAKVAEMRLEMASAGLPKSGRIGFELFDKTNFGATEFVEHINYQRDVIQATSPAHPEATPTATAHPGSDHVELSALSQAAGALSPQRVEEIQSQVSSGTYQVNAAAVSHKIVDFYLIPLK